MKTRSLITVFLFSLAVPSLAFGAEWRFTGNMNFPRANHTATLLNDGTVLVAGGVPDQAATEVYDPAAEAWRLGGRMAQGRHRHTATLLRNGMVLVVGGYISSPFRVTDSCELYDPSSGLWRDTGSLNLGRSQHSATLLLDGRVLVTGGVDRDSENLASAEIYDPRTESWSNPLPMPAQRSNQSATLLRDGRELVVGGFDGVGTTTADVFNPTTLGWTPTSSLNSGHSVHAATLLPDGRVLVAGGGNFPRDASELYDPATDTWSLTGSLSFRHEGYTATLLPSGEVLIAGNNFRDSLPAETYDSKTGAWRPVSAVIRGRDHTATLLPNGTVLVAGGGPLTSGSADAFIYDPSEAKVVFMAPLQNGRNLHTATLLPNGKVLVAGGVTAPRSAELYDPVAQAWSTTGSLNIPRYWHTATLLSNGRVLVTGGQGDALSATTAELYDPLTETWSLAPPMADSHFAHTATLLPDGRVLVAGPLASEIYDPILALWTLDSALVRERLEHTATLLLDGTVLVAGGRDGSGVPAIEAESLDLASSSWTPAGSLTVPRERHTATLLSSGAILFIGGAGSEASWEIFEPGRGTSPRSGFLTQYRHSHTATLLPDGTVMVAGGFGAGALTSVEVFNAGLGEWTPKRDLGGARLDHTATLLLDGRVLIAGGTNVIAGIASTEIYDRGLGFGEAWRPVLDSVTSLPGERLRADGSRFQGISEASGGNGESNSPSNYPLLHLRRIDDEQTNWVPLDSAVGWSDTQYSSLPVGDAFLRPTIATVFTNGIPSVSKFLGPDCAPMSIIRQPESQAACQGSGPVLFSVGVTGTNLRFRWRKDGVPLTDDFYIGTDSDTLVVFPGPSFGGTYDVVVSQACRELPAIVSNAATLTFDVIPPRFEGLASASQMGSVCGVRLDWDSAQPCSTGSSIRYNVYRSDTPDFTPGPGNLYASCRIDAFLNDNAQVTPSNTYHYVVRAEDLSFGFGGPCNGGVEEANQVERTVTLSPACDPNVSPRPLTVFTVTSKDSENTLEWLTPVDGPVGQTRIRARTDRFPVSSNDGELVGEPVAKPGEHGKIAHSGLQNGITFYYSAFVDSGAAIVSVDKRSFGRPFDTTGPTKWSFTTGATALTAPGIGPATYSVSNDRTLHAMALGTAGGVWPIGWTPVVLDGPSQARPPVVSLTVKGRTRTVVVLTSQDGHVYAVDALDGRTPLWTSPPLGMLEGGASIALATFGAPSDWVVVGTRNARANNVVYALNGHDGSVAWSFNDPEGTGIGIVSSAASVDYPSKRVYFTSRAIADGANTLWCLDLATGRRVWAKALGDVDGAVIRRRDRLYVGTNAGLIYAVDAEDGDLLWETPFDSRNGFVKGFVSPDGNGDDLYFATTDNVWSLSDDGGTWTLNWSDGTIQRPSIPLFVNGSPYLFVGGADGYLHRLDVSSGTPEKPPGRTFVLLGAGGAAVGSPSLDVSNLLLYVGTEAGIVYAVEFDIR